MLKKGSILKYIGTDSYSVKLPLMTVVNYFPDKTYGIQVLYHTPLLLPDGSTTLDDNFRTDCFFKGDLIIMNNSGIIVEQIDKHSFI